MNQLVLALFSVFIGYGYSFEAAFSAALTEDTNVEGGEKVVFDHAFVERPHGHFNKTSGVYTSAINGYHVFQFHAVTRKGLSSCLDLRVNGAVKVSSFAYSSASTSLSSGNTVVLFLKFGDKVYVTSHEDILSYLKGSLKENYCTFSGFYLST